MSFERYLKNCDAFKKNEVLEIQKKKVCIVGVGGLGGYVAEILARFGIENITLIDGDVFSISNLNRQRFSNENVMGLEKVFVAKEELKKINSEIKITTINKLLDEKNSIELLSNHDIILDCLDNIESRIILNEASKKLGIPFVHGAIGGFWGQVSTIFPEDDTFNKIYSKESFNSVEKKMGNPSFIPATVASIQCSEAIKYLSCKGELLRNKMLYIDLFYNDFEIIDFT